MINGLIEEITILNPPVQVFNINDCTDIEFTYVAIDPPGGYLLGKNTDGFDIGLSTGITIDYATVYNQDGCVLISSGTNITFKGGDCSSGDGLSIGTVGARNGNTVNGVSFLTSMVTDSVNELCYHAQTKNIVGTDAISSSDYDVAIVCGDGSCSDWTWSDIVITGGKKYSKCSNVPSVAACS